MRLYKLLVIAHQTQERSHLLVLSAVARTDAFNLHYLGFTHPRPTAQNRVLHMVLGSESEWGTQMQYKEV